MKSLFDLAMTDWPQERDALHVYALPTVDESILSPVQNAICETGVCSVQPTGFLHATVSRIPAFRNTVSLDTLTGLQSALSRTTAQISPFDVRLTGPHVLSESVGLEGTRTAEWDHLVGSIQRCVSAVLVGAVMPPPPHAPHVSLGYGISETPSAPLIEAFDRLDSAREHPLTLSVHIHEVHLLAVHQNSTAGVYTWDSISSHSLSGQRVGTPSPSG
ncbi:2'-5' RNA ligase family protein [Rhodococcus sp. IEGM 1381]|uniref:2'-5' RNA ligase family protein n=1 Tax=Rhodococcus sp. IEGM 1381 TaxID=3047085 RepID=UPI0024B81D87|nr:2'-5' RNA ligase family protein [Rhodococcus sp. IEGM 1381]MDI9896464.1 2'-5' RNA ligase family protein [Rhodococcus sp. IEGM 1381]